MTDRHRPDASAESHAAAGVEQPADASELTSGTHDASDDGPGSDPMRASIRSDEEKRRRENPDGDVKPEPPSKDTPDPTDAPDLAGSALSRVSRFGLAGSITLIVVAVAVILLAVLSPDRVSGLLGRAIGVALVGVSLSAAYVEVQRRSFGVRTLSLLSGVGIVGVLLAIDPDRWLRPIGWVIGLALVAAGITAVVAGGKPDGRDGASAVSGSVLVAAGVIAFFTFAVVFEAVVVTIALLAVASGVVGVAVRSGFTTVAPRSRRLRPLLIRWIDAKGRATESRESVTDALFILGTDAPARLARFMLMMVLASVISAAGVLSDSTAVVIGAMLVAPLITPMMGMGLALVTGWPNWLGRSALVVVIGSLIAVGTGALIATVTDVAVDLETNSQIVSRSSPGLIDLVIAVAAGAAGAYAMSRKEASSSLPGVAVAIALVPPLSVVGVTAEGGDWAQAAGTLLLFLTNLVAIILAGGVVFLLTGVVPLRRFADNQHRVRTALASVAALAVVVVGGLIINGQQITADALDLDAVRAEVNEWLGDDSRFTVTSVDVTEGDVAVVLTGPGEPPPAERLVTELAERLGRQVELDLQWIPRQRIVVSSA